jgi:hypothetical protein
LIVKKYAKKLPLDYIIRTVYKNLGQFSSLEDLRDRTAELYPKIKTNLFSQVIEECRLLSYLAGMTEVEDEFLEEKTDSAGKPCGESYIAQGYDCYQEEIDSEFTHDGNRYNLNKVLELVSKKPVSNIGINKLDWILKHTDVDEERAKKADVTTPILITDYKGKIAVVDGVHRLSKAKKEGVEELPTRYISSEELKQAIATQRTDAKVPAWLSQPFKEAIAYFRKKIVIPTQRWDEFTAQNHDFAFTVSGLTKADLLEDVRWLVDKAISEGNDHETFKNQFKRLIGRKGWQPNDKRIYTILDTNSRRAYAAGRYEQATNPEILQSRPYWVWKHRDSVVPRPNHLALDNKAIAANHPFWKVATPACAFGCRCSFFSANERLLNRIGAQILANPPDPKTIADPSFQRAPGLDPEADRQDVLEQGLARLSPDIAEQMRRTKE